MDATLDAMITDALAQLDSMDDLTESTVNELELEAVVDSLMADDENLDDLETLVAFEDRDTPDVTPVVP